MGIHDRHYARSEGPARSGSRTWSVNGWLIAICVGIFVIDGFLPSRMVPIGELIAFSDVIDAVAVDPGDVQNAEGLARARLASGVTMYAMPIADSNGDPMAWQPMRAMSMLQGYFHFSTSRGFLGIEFWRFLGFQFLHANLTHLIFNMIGLYFFGALVERYLGGKRYLAFYLLCGIFGAVLYLALNLAGFLVTEAAGQEVVVRGLLVNSPDTPLIGASAGVFGVIMAGAFLAPRTMVLVFFILPMRLSVLAWLLVGISILAVLGGDGNAGGEAAHLGGAAAGWYFIRRPHHLSGFFDIAGRVDPTSKHFALRKVPASDADVDRILDKINTRGLQSLSAKEKRILHDASHKGRDEH